MSTELAITDTHIHLWDLGRLSYPWLDELPTLQRNFLLPDLESAIKPAGVDKVVFVESGCDPKHHGEEIAWVTELARQCPEISGVVAGASVNNEKELAARLDRLAGNPLVKGVRREFYGEPAEFATQDFVIDSVRRLADYGLSFDLTVDRRLLATIGTFVERCGDTAMVLDHLGEPDVGNGVLDPWRSEIQRLAEYPNLYCKISGLVHMLHPEHWRAEDLRPFVEHATECFGIDRVMFGGDWPLCTLTADYGRWLEALQTIVSAWPATDLRKLFSGNANIFYRLQ
ncbi:MAG: amidohydrolase [Planctomycetaceae bacterium]|nr:amidohydrolase [Planctomycetaceae bacterium]